jgi:hypothetical protein
MYVGCERRWYRSVEKIRSGNDTSVTRASTGDSVTSSTAVTRKSKSEPTTSTSTCRVNVVRVWTSAVSRATSTPARSLSKNGIDRRWRWS